MAILKLQPQITHCPICGFSFAEALPLRAVECSGDVCSCCGCEYGFDDHETYLKDWLEKGAPWFCEDEKPAGWNLEEQLKNRIENWEEIGGRMRIGHLSGIAFHAALALDRGESAPFTVEEVYTAAEQGTLIELIGQIGYRCISLPQEIQDALKRAAHWN